MAKTAGTHPPDPRARLAELADRHDVSLAALSRMIGRNGTYLQQFITKGSPRRLAEEDRARLAEYFGIGEGELRERAEKSYAANRLADDLVRVPRLSLGASAGPGAFAAEERPFDCFGFSPRWLREQGLDPKMLSAILVAGDSMVPALHDGDEILVDRSPRPLRDGIHVVRLGDVLHVKRLQTGRPGVLTLVSDNNAYPPIEVELPNVEIIGRVVWKGGRV